MTDVEKLFSKREDLEKRIKIASSNLSQLYTERDNLINTIGENITPSMRIGEKVLIKVGKLWYEILKKINGYEIRERPQ